MELEETQEAELNFVSEGTCSDCGKYSNHLVPDLDGNPICDTCLQYNGL